MSFLIDNNYKKDTLWQTNRCIKLAFEAENTSKVTAYEDLFDQEVKGQEYKPRESRYNSLQTCIGNVKQFNLKGIYSDDASSRNGILVAPPFLYDQLPPTFKAAIDYHSKYGVLKTKQVQTFTCRFFKIELKNNNSLVT